MKDGKLNSTEIARLAGVSRSTVSRVINGYSNVPGATRERVMRVIREHEYYPRLSGQLLAGKKTGTLGFIWVNGGGIAGSIQCSAFFAHVTESAAKLGYLVLSCIVPNLTDGANRDWVKRIFLQGRVDAGLFIGCDNDEPLVEELIARGQIVALFDHHHPDRREPNRLSVNFEIDTGEKAIDYAAGLGHRRIAVIDGNLNRYSSMMRHLGYIKAMRRHGIEIRPEWMIPGDVDEETGYRAARALLASGGERPGVLCCNNDAVAFGAYAALAEAGLSVPGDVSVVGIDGHEKAVFVSPQLTTFEFDFARIFGSLVERTVAAVEGKKDVPPTAFFPSRLRERGSCRRA